MTRAVFAFCLFFFLLAYAKGTEVAPAKPILPHQEPLQNLKESLSDFSENKTLNEPSLENKIAIFRQILTLSFLETAEVKDRLEGLSGIDERNAALRQKLSASLNDSIAFYRKQQEIVEKPESAMDDNGIKQLAADMKSWRDGAGAETLNQVKDFVLIHQEKSAIAIAESRYAKIEEIIRKFQNVLDRKGQTGILQELSEKAQSAMRDSISLNQKADDLLWIRASSTATTTPETANEATSTPQVVSIKDLVRGSLTKIKEAYQIFIEMSGLVRKSLIGG